MNSYLKYLKYKKKYLDLKYKKSGGAALVSNKHICYVSNYNDIVTNEQFNDKLYITIDNENKDKIPVNINFWRNIVKMVFSDCFKEEFSHFLRNNQDFLNFYLSTLTHIKEKTFNDQMVLSSLKYFFKYGFTTSDLYLYVEKTADDVIPLTILFIGQHKNDHFPNITNNETFNITSYCTNVNERKMGYGRVLFNYCLKKTTDKEVVITIFKHAQNTERLISMYTNYYNFVKEDENEDYIFMRYKRI